MFVLELIVFVATGYTVVMGSIVLADVCIKWWKRRNA